ncbi:uroporphyrinogen-III synthase [Trichonephila inaurata madagascariensis]|uniref:Uroporphyrinogen-III synthase n=1 Tax=Trichonephila inaurata madagascariensis TaxID=2747483 RepID=A0A8X7CRV5_9ARAC|nr:uroporphyrinogen-III synthase [Trichonephila inaurata madagascariensis]
MLLLIGVVWEFGERVPAQNGDSEKSGKTVLLLKSEDEDNNIDPYVDTLKNAGIRATFVPVIEFEFVNDVLLMECLKSVMNLCGIIFTSPRAVTAVKRVSEHYGFKIHVWNKKANFALGDKTAILARNLLGLEVLGSHCTNSKSLADFIGTCEPPDERNRTFLFPCSQKAKDVLEKTLKPHGFNVNRVECYKTRPSPTLRNNLASLVAQKGIPDIVVFFSPSGVEFSHEIIKSVFGATQPNVVAVGETTGAAVQAVNMKLSAIAESPNPEGILNAVKSLL